MANQSTNLIEDTQERFSARLEELRPAVEESRQIEQLLAALRGEEPRSRGTTATAPRAARGQRREEFLEAVLDHPEGISVAEVAHLVSGMHASYGYKLGDQLVAEGAIIKSKDGRFFPPDADVEPDTGESGMPDDPSEDQTNQTKAQV